MKAMKHRWRLWLLLLLLLLLGGLLLVPQVRWPVYGWLRGEAFYQGMPVSWWAEEIEENYDSGHSISSLGVPSLPNWSKRQPPSIWDHFWDRIVADTAPLRTN